MVIYSLSTLNFESRAIPKRNMKEHSQKRTNDRMKKQETLVTEISKVLVPGKGL